MIQKVLFDSDEHLPSAAGWVYLVGERPNQGKWKFGRTSVRPNDRIADFETGNTDVFLAAQWKVESFEWWEQFVHEWVNRHRVRKHRKREEWFWFERDASGGADGETGLQFMRRSMLHEQSGNWGKYASIGHAIADAISQESGRHYTPNSMEVKTSDWNVDGYTYPTWAFWGPHKSYWVAEDLFGATCWDDDEHRVRWRRWRFGGFSRESQLA